jgi:hypothetical protein
MKKLFSILLGILLQITGALKILSSLTVYGPCMAGENVRFMQASEVMLGTPIVCTNWKWNKPQDVDITPHKENLDIAANFFVGASLFLVGATLYS